MPFDPRRDLPTLALVSPPVEDYPYFEGPADALFQPDATGYSPVNAWWLAEASFLAYGDADFVGRRFAGDNLLRQEGMRLGVIGEAGANAGFLMFNDRTVIAVFRGTRVLGLANPLAFRQSLAAHLHDVVTDARFPQAAFDGGQVHEGYLLALEAVAASLEDQLQDLAGAGAGRTVWFTGHSLGGALAVLAAARYGLEKVQGLYTFGCPRVGDAAFAAAFDGRPCYRVVHDNDLVARLPPPLVPWVPPFHYDHVGELVYIDRDGTVTPGMDPSRLPDLFLGTLDWQAVLRGAADNLDDVLAILGAGPVLRLTDVRVPRDAVVDHAPIYYASFLKLALAS